MKKSTQESSVLLRGFLLKQISPLQIKCKKRKSKIVKINHITIIRSNYLIKALTRANSRVACWNLSFSLKIYCRMPYSLLKKHQFRIYFLKLLYNNNSNPISWTINLIIQLSITIIKHFYNKINCFTQWILNNRIMGLALKLIEIKYINKNLSFIIF